MALTKPQSMAESNQQPTKANFLQIKYSEESNSVFVSKTNEIEWDI